MPKISLNELNKSLRQCRIGIDSDEIDNTPRIRVHHIHDWNHGYDGAYGIAVNADGSYANDNSNFYGTRREFYKDMCEINKFLLEYFHIRSIRELIIAPFYQYNQFSFNAEKNDIYEEIYTFLRKNGVRKNERSGIAIDFNENISEIEMVMEGAFRGISELCIFVPTQKLLIVPDHHFGITFFTQQVEKEKEFISELLERFQNVIFHK